MTTSTRQPLTFATPAGNESFEQSLGVARAADAAGFSAVAFSDRPHDPMLEGWTLATAVAARTERIRFFHSTLNVPYRFPAVLAKEAATLDLISGGRLDLCLGAGGEANRPLYDSIGVPLAAPGERLQDLRDAIAILRGMWAGEKFSYRGRAYHVEDANGAPGPSGPIPIWVGARLPRSLRLAGQLADGFMKNGGWGPVDEIRELNQQVSAAATRAGRDPNAIKRVLNGGGFLARNQQELDEYWQRNAANRQSGPTQPAGLVGTAEQVLDLIRDYRAAGTDVFNVRFQPRDALEQIKRFGEAIIPEARKLS